MRNWLDEAHAEALTIERQYAFAVGQTAYPDAEFPTYSNIVDLNRFCECAEDDEGYDVPLGRMRALRMAGFVDGGMFGRYRLTAFGERVRQAYYDEAKP